MWLTVLVSLSLFKTIKPYVWACSSVWLERTPDKGEVGSSSLPRPTTYMNESSIQKSKIFEIVKRSILNIKMTIILMMCART